MGLIIEKRVILGQVVEKTLPILKGSDPTVELERVDVTDVFEGQEVLNFFFDYFKYARK